MAQIGLHSLGSSPAGPSQRIPDPGEFAAVELVLAGPVAARPWRLWIPVPAIEKLAARNYEKSRTCVYLEKSIKVT